ncbi:MAG: hypothetical protein ABIO76_12620 [Ginsengibacter sp.]
MKTKITLSEICKAAFTLVLFTTLFSCKKEAPPVDDSGFNLNVVFKPVAKSLPGSSGYMEFRQDPNTDRIIDLNTWVHHLEPNHSYLLQRAVDPITNPGCASTAWLTLGLGLTPQDIMTNSRGDGHADLWRDISSVPHGAQFHIHFQIVDAVTLATVLVSDCYDYTVR